MKRFVKIFILLTVLVCPSLLVARDRLILASVPWRETAILKEIYRPLVALLKQELKVDVTLVITRDYKELGKRLDIGAADIGIFGANSYIQSKERYPGIQYLVTSKQPDDMYHSLIIVHRDSDIKSLAQLKGKSFAFTDKQSTSGYLYPLLIMRKKGVDPCTFFSRVYFLNKHDKVYDAVARKTIAAGGVTSSAFDRSVRRNGNIYRVIEKSEPIPRSPIVAGAHLPPALVERLISILVSAEHQPRFKSISSTLTGFSRRSDRFYNIVREVRGAKR